MKSHRYFNAKHMHHIQLFNYLKVTIELNFKVTKELMHYIS